MSKGKLSEQLKNQFSNTATKAGQGAKNVISDAIKMQKCDNLKQHFSITEYPTYRALIRALSENEINPDTVTYEGTTDKGRTILLSYNHIITETDKIRSVPGTLAFNIKKGTLVDLYKKSQDNEAREIEKFKKERAKDAEARKRRSRGIVAHI